MKHSRTLFVILWICLICSFVGCSGGGGNGTSTESTPESKDRYFWNLSTSEMLTEGRDISTLILKTVIIKNQVYEHWALIRDTFGFPDPDKAWAFFLAVANERTSTLIIQGEKGYLDHYDYRHHYGLFCVSDQSYISTYASQIEKEVPEMVQYDYKEENVYDPGISAHMGIRSFICSGRLVKANNYKGIDILRYTIYNYEYPGAREVYEPSEYILNNINMLGALANTYYEGHLADNYYSTVSREATQVDISVWDWLGIPSTF